MHQQVYPFVVKQSEQRSDRTGCRHCPNSSVTDIAQSCCDPGSDQHRRADNRTARPNRIRPAQQQPREIIWFAVMAFMGVSGSQQFTDPPALRGVKQGSMDHPFDRPDRHNHGHADGQVGP